MTAHATNKAQTLPTRDLIIGHFALDEATDEIASLVRDFLGRVET